MGNLIFRNADGRALEFTAPVFIDSLDLSDLGMLRQHVIKSKYFVFLLTPTVLMRPWCLVELVTAVENEVEIVLVEIQRPGSCFSYPDDEFYTNLASGRVLTPSAMQFLAAENIRLVGVERALRQAFQKIALPFSPHKSPSIRQAELSDILKRCKVVTNQGQKTASLASWSQR